MEDKDNYCKFVSKIINTKVLNRFLYFLFFLTLFVSCTQNNETTINHSSNDNQTLKDSITNSETSNESKIEKCLDSILLTYNLVDILSIDSTIKVDLKYASKDNFMRQQLYTSINKLYLQKDVAIRLSNVQQYLKSLHPNYSLLLYDGVRPVSVQQKMWDALDSIPPQERGKFVSNPKNHSVHNYGAAIDLTIIDDKGIPLDMGANYDDIRKIAYPSMENYFLSTGELKPFQVENRKLLRKVMQKEKFINIPSEWWHFNAYTRNEVKNKYKILENEPECSL